MGNRLVEVGFLHVTSNLTPLSELPDPPLGNILWKPANYAINYKMCDIIPLSLSHVLFTIKGK